MLLVLRPHLMSFYYFYRSRSGLDSLAFLMMGMSAYHRGTERRIGRRKIVALESVIMFGAAVLYPAFSCLTGTCYPAHLGATC
jgi:hypothetical protein